ncbi:uncharacterized protein LOC117505992 [Thalassophryne amazonica]|uniref:uncharacterized protein LOC117505992 n=1 Tax=Thalassophryne amazonica TaxID=390379 RepID=UPI001471CB8E|nr:uncharacterized protein LOC117505992 [Thalassophryne amazonica]XP_034021427.1 uncharacterized protein LOC117505992 [Thalassophryne amazonica]
MPRKVKEKLKEKTAALIQSDSRDTSSVIPPMQRNLPLNEVHPPAAPLKKVPTHVLDPNTCAPTRTPTAILPATSTLPSVASQNPSYGTVRIQQSGTKRARGSSPDSSEDSEEERGVPKHAKRRTKLQPTSDLTEEQEDELVEWIRKRPIFYDQSMREFKNKHKKNRLWEMKAKKMGVDAIALMTWFRNKRTIYCKLKKTKSGQAARTLTGRQRWTLETFKFLDEYLTVRTASSQLGVTRGLHPTTQGDEEEDEGLHIITTTQQHHGNTTATVTPTSDAQLPRTFTKKTRKKKPSVDEAIVSMCTRLASRPSPAVAPPALTVQSNRRVAYCHYLASEVMQMTEEQWLHFQRSCNEQLYRMNVELLQQQQGPPAPAAVTAVHTQHPQRPASVPASVPLTPSYSSTTSFGREQNVQQQGPWTGAPHPGFSPSSFATVLNNTVHSQRQTHQVGTDPSPVWTGFEP